MSEAIAPTESRLPLAMGAGAVAAVVVAVLVRTVGVALGAAQTQQLMLGVDGLFAAAGGVAGAYGWSAIRARAKSPRWALTRAVPVVLVGSLVPDVLLGVGGSAWSAVVTLMAMHLAIGAAVVPVLARIMPVEQ